ncbi:hypothetical protein [Aquimarina macrocephali]|uniref:hypothetical protein n=1 Tax=Aquimarina macrocephali TaxID=666563 RepID=UPI003F661A9C
MDENTTITLGQLKRFFKENDMIAAPREELQADISRKQAAYLRKKFLTIGQVLDGEFFPEVKTRQTIRNWMMKGKLKKDQDWIFNSKGRRVILTSYLKKVVKD